MVDPMTMGKNFALLIGVAVLLGATFMLTVATWTTINIVIWLRQRRVAELEYRATSFRADGRPYPMKTEGVCSHCGRGSNSIFFPPGGQELCPVCYEQHWQSAEQAGAA